MAMNVNDKLAQDKADERSPQNVERVVARFWRARSHQAKSRPIVRTLVDTYSNPEATPMPLDVFLVGALRALIEVAGFALLGRGVLALLVGERRHDNPFYRILAIISAPAIHAARFMTPRAVADGRVPVVAFVLVFCLWIALAWLKRHLCGLHGIPC
jgi:hypothetical protein